MGIILGISGQAGVGKDTMADYLVKTYGFTKVALADPLKRVCREVYDFSETQLWGPSAERNKPDLRYATGLGHLTPRKALQLLGTEWGRVCYEDTWTDYALRMAVKVLEGHSYDARTGLCPSHFLRRLMRDVTGVAIPDVRFENEVKRIRRAGGLVVRLKRKVTAVEGGISKHASEEEQKSLPDSMFDFVLEVPEGIDHYHKAVDQLYVKLPKTSRVRPST